MTAFLRVSDGPILLRCEITEPDDCVILDPTLMKAIDVTQGLKPGGTILVNTDRPQGDYAGLALRFRVALVDASAIARGLGLGSRTQPIVNTSILGAFAAATGLVSLESVCASIAGAVRIKTEQNVEAARAAARSVVKLASAEVQNA